MGGDYSVVLVQMGMPILTLDIELQNRCQTSPKTRNEATDQASQMINIDTMRAGLLQGEFFLEYMPTIFLADGCCTGAEAVIRWRRAGSVILPGDFIPIVENTPLSGLITYWVIETLAAEMGNWLRANPDARISINIPPEILGRGGVMYAAVKSALIELHLRSFWRSPNGGCRTCLESMRSTSLGRLAVRSPWTMLLSSAGLILRC